MALHADRAPRILTLDGIRGMAIIAVLFYHFADQFKSAFSNSIDKTVVSVLLTGWVGVDLFFVLSGFLITGILLESRGKKGFFTDFYGRRSFRIFPLYYCFLILVCFVGPAFSTVLAEQSAVIRGDVGWHLLYLSNVLVAMKGGFSNVDAGYLWSLSVEEQFYLVWPLAVFFLRIRSLVIFSLLLFFSSLVFRLVAISNGWTADSVYVLTFTHFEPITVGSLLAILYRSKNWQKRLRIFLFGIGIVSLVIVLRIWIMRGGFVFYDVIVAKWGVSLCALIFGAFVWKGIETAESARSVTYRVMTNSILRSFGKYSYCIYLIHVPVGLVIEKLLLTPQKHLVFDSIIPAFVCFTCMAFASCWTIGFFSWKLLERPILKLKDKLF